MRKRACTIVLCGGQKSPYGGCYLLFYVHGALDIKLRTLDNLFYLLNYLTGLSFGGSADKAEEETIA